MAAAGSPKYFAPDHMFMLLGHGLHNEDKDTRGVILNRSARRYALKDNEYYARSTTCGKLGSLKSEEVENFMLYKIPFDIPSIDEKNTFYGWSFPKKTSRELNLNLWSKHFENKIPHPGLFNELFPTLHHRHKIYAPFLINSPASSTVSNEYVTLFSIHPENKSKFITPAVPFTFMGKEYDANKQKMNLYKLKISGIVSAGNSTIKSIEEQDKLMSKSQQIAEIFKIINPSSVYLYIVIPQYCLTKNFENDYSDDPLVQYLKEALIAMQADSIFKSYHYMVGGDTFKNVINQEFKISDIFEIIRDILKDDMPILLINDLCRPVSSSIGAENEEFSNIESNNRSYHPNHPIRARRNKTKRLNKSKKILNTMRQTINRTKNGLLANNFERYKETLSPSQLDFFLKRMPNSGRFRSNITRKRFLNTIIKNLVREVGPTSKSNLYGPIRLIEELSKYAVSRNSLNQYYKSMANKIYTSDNFPNNE